MDYLEYKGYKGTVEYCKEDDCLVGKVIGMHKDLIAYEGCTLAELREDFEAAAQTGNEKIDHIVADLKLN